MEDKRLSETSMDGISLCGVDRYLDIFNALFGWDETDGVGGGSEDVAEVEGEVAGGASVGVLVGVLVGESSIVTDSTDESELSLGAVGAEASGKEAGLECSCRVKFGGAFAFGVTEVASLC